MTQTLSAGRVGGIPVRLHLTWFLAVVLVVWSLGASFFPDTAPGHAFATYWLAAVVVALLLFLSLLAHEFAHAMVARRRGMDVLHITLYLFGGMATIRDDAEDARDEFWIAAVGPLTSLGLGALFSGLWFAGRGASPLLEAIVLYLAVMNIALALFNLLPGFPLDGGRMLRSVIWWRTGDPDGATRRAATVGVVLGFVLVALGLVRTASGAWANGVWLVFVGWYVQSMAGPHRTQSVTPRPFAGLRVADLTDETPPSVGPAESLDRVVRDIILGQQARAVPVVEAGRLRGLLTLDRIIAVPRDRWPATRAVEALLPLTALQLVAPDTSIEEAIRLLAAHDLDQLAVVELPSDQFVGLLHRSAIVRHIEEQTARSPANRASR